MIRKPRSITARLNCGVNEIGARKEQQLMRLILQRVSQAAVTIEGADRREIDHGLMILVGFTSGDTPAMCERLAKKSVELRIFEDDAGAMNRSLLDVGGECLIVSQFTLYANSRKGRRPSFIEAALPKEAIPLYERFIDEVKKQGVEVKTGEFGAEMKVEIINDGPVTILLDSAELMSKS